MNPLSATSYTGACRYAAVPAGTAESERHACTPGVDSLFRLSLRGPAPAPAAVALSQLAVSVALLAKGFTVVTSAAFAVVVAALFQGIDKSAAGDGRDFFRGKTVWITGASSGIGEALAYACHSAGARVILSARRMSELERVGTACVGVLITELMAEDVFGVG